MSNEKRCLLGWGLLFLAVGGCSASRPAADPPKPSAKHQVKVESISRMNLRDGSQVLVINYETEIAIEDMKALEAEVDALWPRFQSDVEKAGVAIAIVRAARYEGKGTDASGMGRHGRGYRFMFQKDHDGVWKRVAGDLPK